MNPGVVASAGADPNFYPAPVIRGFTANVAGSDNFTSNTTSVVTAIPSATVVGDLLVAIFGYQSMSAVTDPAGWTPAFNLPNAAARIYTRTALAGDAGTNTTFTRTGLSALAVMITAFGACRIMAHTENSGLGVNNLTLPVVASSGYETLVVPIWVAWSGTGITASGSTDAISIGTSAGHLTVIAMGKRLQSVAGNSTTCLLTAGAANYSGSQLQLYTGP